MVMGSTGTWRGPFGYSGSAGYQGDETGLQLLGHRYYDSSTGRFITRDPIKDGRNWYAYCENNPVAYIDADGLQIDSVTGTIRQALAKAVTNPAEALEMLEGLIETGGLAEKQVRAIQVAQRAIGILQACAARTMTASARSLQHAFSKHAGDWGFKAVNWSKSVGEKFLNTLLKFIRDPARVVRDIAYRGVKGHKAYLDPKTGQTVIVDAQGNLVAAFKLVGKQLEAALKGGNVW
jgi:RHS repeat-associated protein